MKTILPALIAAAIAGIWSGSCAAQYGQPFAGLAAAGHPPAGSGIGYSGQTAAFNRRGAGF
ncbi:MAG: hypothetical protein ACKOEO_11630, partial [Planctomycetaceae bacterium]